MEALTGHLRIKGLKPWLWYAALPGRKTRGNLGASTKDNESREQEN